MSKTLSWGIAALIILLVGTAGVLFILHQRAELAQFEQQAKESEKLLTSSDKSSQQRNAVQRRGDAVEDREPPPGETDDTGHWEGNVWHQKTAPKPKKNWWSGEMDIYAYREKIPFNAEAADRFRASVIEKQPYSEAALAARMNFATREKSDAETIEALKASLKYHPESPALLTELAIRLEFDSPEEAVAFGKKALRLLPNSSENSEEIYTNLASSSVLEGIHSALGIAYQKLGDYKSALVHLKQAQRLYTPRPTRLANDLGPQVYPDNIAAIEAGKPIHAPDPQPTVAPDDFSLLPSAQPQPHTPGAPGQPPPPDALDFTDTGTARKDFSPADASFPSEASMRAAASEHATGDFGEPQGEFNDFLRWMERIEQAESPEALDNFLMRQMALQLQSGNAKFTPDRLIRAFETMNRHGELKGMQQLQQRDKELAREIERHKQSRKRAPQRTEPVRPKTK